MSPIDLSDLGSTQSTVGGASTRWARASKGLPLESLRRAMPSTDPGQRLCTLLLCHLRALTNGAQSHSLHAVPQRQPALAALLVQFALRHAHSPTTLPRECDEGQGGTKTN